MLKLAAVVLTIAFIGPLARAADKIPPDRVLIEGHGLRLRLMTPEKQNEPKFDRELTRVLETMTDPETVEQFWQGEVTDEKLEALVTNLESGPMQKDQLQRAFYLVTDTLRDQVLGLVFLSWRDREQKFNFGYAVHPNERGRRIGTKAAQLIKDFVERHHPNEDIVAIVRESNIASRNVLANAGFGLRRSFSDKSLCVYALVR